MKGTREAVVYPNYVWVYEVTGDTVTVLRVLYTSQSWPGREGRKGVIKELLHFSIGNEFSPCHLLKPFWILALM